QKIYKKDYGFDTINDNFMAIPYSYVNTPLIGSEFTDSEIKMIFTSLAYFIEGLRDIDEKYIRSKLIKTYNQSKDYPFLLQNNIFIKTLNINIECITDVKYLKKLDISKYRKNNKLIKKYLAKEIFPKYINKY